jgi:hypothetical protein
MARERESKRKKYKGQYRGKGKASQNSSKKHDKTKIKYFNCDKKGHYARKCNEPRKVRIIENISYFSYVSSYVFMADSYPLWIVDSGATDHVAKDRDLFVDFPQGSKWLYVGNNSHILVKSIGTCKLDMCDGRTLLLHDVLFAPEIRRNLKSVVVLLRFGFTLNMCSTSIKLYLNDVCYGYGYVSNGFIILDVVNI